MEITTPWADCPARTLTIEHLLCVEPCSKHFLKSDSIISSSQQPYEVQQAFIIPPFKDEETEAQGGYNIPEATWLVSGGAGTHVSAAPVTTWAYISAPSSPTSSPAPR